MVVAQALYDPTVHVFKNWMIAVGVFIYGTPNDQTMRGLIFVGCKGAFGFGYRGTPGSMVNMRAYAGYRGRYCMTLAAWVDIDLIMPSGRHCSCAFDN